MYILFNRNLALLIGMTSLSILLVYALKLAFIYLISNSSYTPKNYLTSSRVFYVPIAIDSAFVPELLWLAAVD